MKLKKGESYFALFVTARAKLVRGINKNKTTLKVKAYKLTLDENELTVNKPVNVKKGNEIWKKAYFA